MSGGVGISTQDSPNAKPQLLTTAFVTRLLSHVDGLSAGDSERSPEAAAHLYCLPVTSGSLSDRRASECGPRSIRFIIARELGQV